MAREWLAFMTTGLLWGSSFLWIKIALEEVGPFTLVTLRLFFGILGLLIGMLGFKKKFPRDRKTLFSLAIMAVLSPTIPFLFISWGETRIDSGIASILNGTVPLFTILLAHLFLADEKITRSKALGLVLGFIGVVILVGRDIGSAHSSNALGCLAVVFASIVYALSGVYSRRNLRGLSPVVQATCLMMFAEMWVLLALPITPGAHFVLPHLALTWIAVAWLGLLGTCTAFLCYFYLLNRWGATRASLVNYLFPMMGLALGIIFRHEAIDWHLILGSGFVMSGILIVSFKGLIK